MSETAARQEASSRRAWTPNDVAGAPELDELDDEDDEDDEVLDDSPDDDPLEDSPDEELPEPMAVPLQPAIASAPTKRPMLHPIRRVALRAVMVTPPEEGFSNAAAIPEKSRDPCAVRLP